MKKRILLFSLIAGILFLAFFSAVMINLTASYRASADNIRQNYRISGKTITDLIKTAVENNAEVVYSVQDHVYDVLISEIKANPERYRITMNTIAVVFDTVTEGFYFSGRMRSDSFVVTIFSGKYIYRNADSKEWFDTIRKNGGPGRYIQNLKNMTFIEYIAIQDEQGLITATGNIDSLKGIYADSMLMYAFVEGEDIFRRNGDVFEYITPVSENGYVIRAGFDASEFNDAVGRARTLYIVISVTMTLMALLIMMMLFFYYRSAMYSERLLKKESERAAYFDILAEGIVVIENGDITACNDSALNILNVNKKEMTYDFLKQNGFTDHKGSGSQTVYRDRNIIFSASEIEPGKMIITFSDVSELEDLRKENEIKRKQAMLGELSFRVAHELKNPLNGLSMIVQRIMKEITHGEHREMLEDALTEIERMNSRIVQFTGFAKSIHYRNERIPLRQLIEEAADSVKIIMREKDIDYTAEIEDAYITGDKEYLTTAFTNILLNAAQAVDRNGIINVKTHCEDRSVFITVKDNGHGLTPEQIERAFELYYTTKKDGSGIGLSTAKKIIDEHGGEIRIESRQGTTVTVILKCSKEK